MRYGPTGQRDQIRLRGAPTPVLAALLVMTNVLVMTNSHASAILVTASPRRAAQVTHALADALDAKALATAAAAAAQRSLAGQLATTVDQYMYM